MPVNHPFIYQGFLFQLTNSVTAFMNVPIIDSELLADMGQLMHQ